MGVNRVVILGASGFVGSAVLRGRATDIINIAHFLPLAYETTPLPIESTVRPADLKRAMRRMATSHALANLDMDTVNKLAYNNATTS